MSARDRIFGLLVDRPVLTLMVTLAIVSVGAMALSSLPLRLVPAGMVSSRINVWVPIAQSQTPRETEEKVLKPAEELLQTIPGLRQIRASAHSRGARFWIDLDEDLDPTLASAEVRDRLQRAKASWPEGVDRYITWREDASEVPLAFFQMLTPERNKRWDHLVENVVQPRLEAVEGVGRVEVWGNLEESIRIWFDREKLIAHRVDYRDLIRRLADDNFTEPIGELKSRDERLLLRVDSKFKSLQEIA
ncbi:MAG: efflux RND transporter permease subunit, partial [Planctomycetota bacterium]